MTAEEKSGKSSTKIYFFLIAIVALLFTNVYFYVKYKNSGDQVHLLHSEKMVMRTEIDRIEADLDEISASHTDTSTALKAAQDSVRHMIVQLRETLATSNLSRTDLSNAQYEINKLRNQVAKYGSEMEALKRHNAELIEERGALRDEISSSSTQIERLQDENVTLSDQLRTAAMLKVSNFQVTGVRERWRNRESTDSKARRVDKIKIDFTIADNSLVSPGPKDIYLRIIDPNGNLRSTENNTFEVAGKPMQYTYKTSINFTNDGEQYSLEWSDDSGFQKGTYTLLLYADHSLMGRSSIVLN